MLIRPEVEMDRDAVRAVNISAFSTPAESKLVDELRDRANPVISLVADKASSIVGHIMFSPVTIPEFAELKVMGLAPMSVLPEYQRTGIGSALVEEGLEACRRLGCDGVVVLGHPEFYPRFGFQPASSFGIVSEYDVPDDVFMAREIFRDSLKNVSGIVKYHACFAEL